MDLDFIKNLAYRKKEDTIDKSEVYVWEKIYESLTTDKELDDDLIPIIARELLIMGVNKKNLRRLFEILNYYAEREEDVLTKKNIIFILNILSQEFSNDICVLNLMGLFDAQINQTITLLDNNDASTWEETLVIDQIYDAYDLAFIYKEILKHYERQMKVIVDLIMQEEISFSVETMDELEEDFNKIYLKYKYILNKFNKLDFSHNNEQEEVIEEDVGERRLYYSTNSKEDASKCYFVRDLKNIRETALWDIFGIIENFEKGYSNNIKTLKRISGLKSYIELKYDDIRIVLTRIKDNAFSVMGVFIKKSDNDIEMYKNLMERPIADIDDSYSAEVEDYYKEFILNNGRKGSR